MGALLLSVLLAAAAQAAPEVQAPVTTHPGTRKLSEPLREALRRVNRELSGTEYGRYLLTLTAQVPIVERRQTYGRPVRAVLAPELVIEVDAERAPRLLPLEFELLFLRARWKALCALPIELADEEMAAEQSVLEHALQKAEADKEFAAKLRQATAGARELVESRRRMQKSARGQGNQDPVLFPGMPPKDPLARIAFGLYLFSEDPYAVYAAAVDTAGLGPEAVTLTELKDFLDLHGADAARVQYRADGRLAVVEGRVYPGRVARAAAAVRDREGLARVEERLGPFRGAAQQDLTKRVNAWLRSVP